MPADILMYTCRVSDAVAAAVNAAFTTASRALLGGRNGYDGRYAGRMKGRGVAASRTAASG